MSSILNLTFGNLMEISRETKMPLKNIFDILTEADSILDEKEK